MDDEEEENTATREDCVGLCWQSSSIATDIVSLSLGKGIKSVAVGLHHYIALTFDGLVYAKGDNTCGQLGLGDFESRDDFVVVSYFMNKPISNIDCGSLHSAALTSKGTVYCWGDTSSGQCGVGELKTVAIPARVHFTDSNGKDNSPIIRQVACGEMHSLGLTDDGQVWAWGSGVSLGLGNCMERALTPRLVEDFVSKKVLSIACGSFHSMAIVDGATSQSKPATPVSSAGGQDSPRSSKLSTRLRIPRRQKKLMINREGSNSVPLIKKDLKNRQHDVTNSESSSSDDDNMFRKTSPWSESSLSPEDIHVSVNEEGSSMLQLPSLDLMKITDYVMSGVTSLKTTLTASQHSSTDDVACVTTTPENVVSPQSLSNEQLPAVEPLSVQLWTWGRGTCGQLGHGTTQDRFYPSIVEELNGVHIVKIVAGTHHSLALTNYSQVYAWGDNSHCQLGIKKNVVNKPRKVKSLSDIMVWDIAAGSHYSLFLGQKYQEMSDVYMCGKNPSGLPMSCMNSLMEFQANISPFFDTDNVSVEKKCSTIATSRSQPDMRTILTTSEGVHLGQLHFQKNFVLRNIVCCAENCVCLAVRNPPQWLTIVSEIANHDRGFYYKLALIWQALLEPLLVDGGPSNNEQATQLRLYLCKIFHSLMRRVSIIRKQVQSHIRDVNDIADVIGTLNDDKLWEALERYTKVYSDLLACDVFDSWTKESSNILLKVLDDLKEDGGKAENISLEHVLKVHWQRLSQYKETLTTLHALFQHDGAGQKTLNSLMAKVDKLLTSDKEWTNEARNSKEFWRECPAKITELYKRPNRRVLMNSKLIELFPVKSGRFTSHWFVLLSDTFLHIQSNKNYQAYDLATVWASPVPDTQGENFTNAIKITTPEEGFTLRCKSSIEKAHWLVAINQAVAKVISKTTTYNLSSETVNTKCGSFTPAKARETSYFFNQDPKYKGACYNGMWLSGKPHGFGKMVWSSTAQTYEGEFKNGLYDGFGYMVFVLNPSAGVAEEYEGEWKDGMMHGQGKMSYSDKQTYEGHWVHNERFGHGVLRMGNLTSPTPSIFIGNWEHDKRLGFGVMDDIKRGEKYMGMWENDMRSGKGLMVTLDGIYNEGRFVMNKLMGHGVLLCDDDTRFEGEFCGDAQINGKGILTMPNGDSIEGTFQGAWNSGLKVNGVYQKGTKTDDSLPIEISERADPSLSPYYIPAERKWGSVFAECRKLIGCRGDIEPEVKKAWKCVSTCLSRGQVSKDARQERQLIDDVLKGVDLDRAKKIGKDKKKLQEYLSKAFDVACHPLGRLMDTLVDVYRATYVGMGAHSRLLPHAVEEIKSYISRVYAVVRILFPNLPSEEFIHLGDDNETENTEQDIIDSNSLLGPIMYPRFYPPLFTLYALDNEKSDSAYWERIHQLNKRTDLALMSYLEIKRTYWLVPEEKNGVMHDTDPSNWKHTHYYEKAVEAFQQISTKFSPMEKLSVLRETFQQMHKELQEFSNGKAKLMSLDDLFPVFQFVVIRSRVHHLGSEIGFIEDLMQYEHRSGENGHMFTTLKACYYQILNEN